MASIGETTSSSRPKLKKTRTEEDIDETPPEIALRSSTDPTLEKEKSSARLSLSRSLKKCFRPGDKVEFILSHASILSSLGWEGIHLGLRVTQTIDGVQQRPFTIGFYGRNFEFPKYDTPLYGGPGSALIKGSLYSPDPHIEEALKNENPKNKPNIIHITQLSQSAADSLNKYTCSDDRDIKEIEWRFWRKLTSSGKGKKDGEGKKEVKFVGVQYPTDKNYAFAFTCYNKSTNCQGFILQIFRNDHDVIDAIIPHLHGLGAAEVRRKKGFCRIVYETAKPIVRCGIDLATYAPRRVLSDLQEVPSRMFGYEEEGEYYLPGSFGGYKKRRTRKKKRKKIKKRKTRRKNKQKKTRRKKRKRKFSRRKVGN